MQRVRSASRRASVLASARVALRSAALRCAAGARTVAVEDEELHGVNQLVDV
jgi:hypothetical protein